MSRAIWGAVFIAAGIVALIATLELVPGLSAGNALSLIFVTAGVVFLIEAAIRLLVPTFRRPVTGTLILAFILLAIGVGGIIGFRNIWPLVLIAIGVIILAGQFLRR